MANSDHSAAKFTDSLSALKKSRGIYKRKITLQLKHLQQYADKHELTPTFLNTTYDEINSIKKTVEDFDTQINQLLVNSGVDEEVLDYELEEQTEYLIQINATCSQLKTTVSEENNYNNSFGEAKSSCDIGNADQLVELIKRVSYNDGKPPPLECNTFDGTEKDKFAFNTFINQFEVVVGSKSHLSNSTKLAYLKSFLKEYALSVVNHLSVTDDNYTVAIDLLNKEFLDTEYIIDHTLNNLLKSSPSWGNDLGFQSVKVYINEVRAQVYELQRHGVDFLLKNSAGLKMISHIIFNKFPSIVKKEFIHYLNNNYPSLIDIFDNYHHVLNLLSRTNSDSKYNPSGSVRPKKIHHKSSYEKIRSSVDSKPAVRHTFQNFKAENKSPLCKLCNSHSHTLGKCSAFPSYKSKADRLKELTLCIRCAGAGHDENSCFGKQGNLKFPCKHCSSKEHFTSLCPFEESQPEIKTVVNLCLAQRSFDSSKILPTTTITLKCGRREKTVRCLIDTGSQRSYVSQSAFHYLSRDLKLYELECEIDTYMGQGTKIFKQMSTGIKLGKKLVFVPLLVDDEFNIQFEVPGLSKVINKFKQNKIKLLDDTFYNDKDHDLVKVDMLLGIDIIQHMFSLSMGNMLGGACLAYNNEVAPIGNIYDFLTEQEGDVVRKLVQSRYQTGPTEIRTSVNAVIEPFKSYFNPLENILSDSEVDNGLENLFSLESIGIKTNDSEMTTIDQEQVDKFKNNIEFSQGHYHVSLPWQDHKVNSVPSNYSLALKVLDRTVKKLESTGLREKYEAVFDQQLKDGIIEEINLDPSEYKDKVWIPHRPVIKTEEQVTTKIRPVFNCSLKTNKDLPSLNEAAYTGIDMMNNILEMLLKFRSNNYVMLSDVKQAFLMIKLKEEADKNRFCFFWRRGNRIITYRFKTIVFGFTSSSFILHNVMQHHANSFPDDKVSNILANNFYVDNLIITGNKVDEMNGIYTEAYDRMHEGGFELRSWNSNSQELRDKMALDKRLVEHNCPEEKVLGYKYNFSEDTLSIASVKLDPLANTKRKILSQTSKLFDPINFTLPVTIRGKILMRKIWQSEASWDETLDKEICGEMQKLSRDLELLPQLSFDRQALNEDKGYGLHCFCDSSNEAYGFVVYAVTEDNTKTFVFAKSKLVPLKTKNPHSIPTLELMGVILALKCLPSILDSYKGMQINFINISVDAQVVLNWLLTKETKTKSRFLRNRILDAYSLKVELSKKYNIPMCYRYVNTEENPADLVTKGLTYSKFVSKLEFWLKGPQWLTNDFSQWPQYPLLSISPDQKPLISTMCTRQPAKVNTGILNLNKYSSIKKLIRCTSYMYKFLRKDKDCDTNLKAWEYWIKTVQKEHFNKELEFLELDNNNKEQKAIPPLVNNLNLFIDDKGIVRSRGRISKCLYFNFNVHNPIVLPKESKFTQLYIHDCHTKMQHLGIGTTLNYIREQGFWIPKGRMAVKSVISSCMTCKKFNTLAYKYPKYTEMPKHHMNLVKPFQHVGVDYTGHIWVKDEETAKLIKVFTLVFTCLNIRAVHFELLTDMSTKSFLMAFQRFCNIYSIPQYLYSDNAKSFLKGGSILANSLKSKEFEAELEKCNIKHIKIPIYSAWVGSAWERLIRTMKHCLFKVVGRAKLTYYELLTSLSSIQLAINSRPLTYRSSSDELEPITPNSFLRLHCNSSIILRDNAEIWVDNQENLETTLAIQEEILDHFKKLWYNEYLLSLREHSRNLYQSNWEDRIKINDVVLIKSILKPRPYWMMGRVIELIWGSDGKVRTVKVKQGNGAVEVHSICNLYPLEVSVTHAGKDAVTPVVAADRNDSADSSLPITTRPKRKATLRFDRMLRDNLGNL